MSGPRPVISNVDAFRSLTERLKAEAATPLHRLSATEERLLAIAKTIFIDCVLCARMNRVEKTGEPMDRCLVTEAIAAEGARYALAAAIEVEAPLRELRERMEGRR